MRAQGALLVALFAIALAPPAHADAGAGPAGACAPPGSLACPTYQRYQNRRYAFTVDIPAFFTPRPADGDGRGQPFELVNKARMRAWAMYDNPPMTADQLYGDWTRRDGVTFKTLVGSTWVVRGKDGPRLYYSRSILADGIICTIEVSYVPEIADAIEPILARVGASLAVVPGAGVRTHAR